MRTQGPSSAANPPFTIAIRRTWDLGQAATLDGMRPLSRQSHQLITRGVQIPV